VSDPILLTFEAPLLAAALREHFAIWTSASPETLGSAEKRQIRAIVTHSSMPLSNELIASFPDLRIICLFSAGFEGIDVEFCNGRGIAVTHCSGANAGDVADHAFGLMIDVARRISLSDRGIRKEGWSSQLRLDPGVSGARLGLLGFGAIGAACARRAEGFEMEVAYCARRPRPDVRHRFFETPADLARAVDFLVVACPLTAKTRHAVDATVLAALGPRGILVNVARGEVVDELALIEALETHAILGAGLDVYAHEPNVPARLKALDNVVMTPHRAALTLRSFRNMSEMVTSNLKAAFSGGRLVNALTA
jgi:lactate dehydrogenase-like 2-hydroxyacid dehydrogenase